MISFSENKNTHLGSISQSLLNIDRLIDRFSLNLQSQKGSVRLIWFISIDTFIRRHVLLSDHEVCSNFQSKSILGNNFNKAVKFEIGIDSQA